MPVPTDFSHTPNLAKLEEAILKFWEKDDTFQKSIDQRSKDNTYVFFDGPPFATGLPHYGHIVASTMKDIIPRYWTMKGKRVERKWGWDCHGLPIENIAEKELGIKRKKEIEELGVAQFNEVCRSRVLSYVDEWKKIITRLGRWADMENDYKTMDPQFMESVWWVFKQLYDKGLVYEDYRSMHICPRCETTLSQSEVAEGYKDITDISVTVEFKVTNQQQVIDTEQPLFMLAWTTTPWTLPGNVLLAVGADIEYVIVTGEEPGKLYVVARERVDQVFGEGKYQVVTELTGNELVGLTYEPLFPYYADTEHAFRVVSADFVTTEDGTGVVHIAPAFGENDFQLGQAEHVPLVQHVKMDGRFKKAVTDFAGLEVKPKEHPQQTDIEIIKYLAHYDQLFNKQKITHSYPHCWRCDTPLLNYATSSWFVNVTKVKPRLLELAEKIHWSPEHIKRGRWENWLKGAKDWSISRQRYWASVIPIWRCDCGQMKVYGSIAELEQDSGQTVTDLHKHIVDQITVPCECGGEMHRIPDVLDTWFDSGSMPYGQAHYPFENQQQFEQNFPAEFIGEGIDQTRAWFYYLHVIAGAIKDTNAFQNVIVNGIVLAEDGKKMSKRLQNYPDPVLLIDKYGSDSLRLYLASSPVLKAENLNFSEKEVADIRRKVFIIWWNMVAFYEQFADTSQDVTVVPSSTSHSLDKWLVSRVQSLIDDVTQTMDHYDIVRSTRMLMEFVDELSTWYLRLSRDRLREGETRESASHAFGYALYTLAQLMAPFAPFFSETVNQILLKKEVSVHLSDWPIAQSELVDSQLEAKMVEIKRVVEEARSLRKEAGLKVRQPLSKLTVHSTFGTPSEQLLETMAQELNVKTVEWLTDDSLQLQLDTSLTPELLAEGQAREVVRTIQSLRKEAGLQPDTQVVVQLPEWPEAWTEYIKHKTNTSELRQGTVAQLIV